MAFSEPTGNNQMKRNLGCLLQSFGTCTSHQALRSDEEFDG